MFFLTTVVGSYPRPRWLIDELIKLQGKQKESESKFNAEVEEAFCKATKEIIEEQENLGIQLITDGQLRWNDALAYIAEKISGFEMNGLIRYYDNNFYYRRPEIVSNIEWVEPILVNDFLFSKKLSKKSEVKAVLPGPYTLYNLSINKSSFKKEELILKIGEALSKEIKALQSAGCNVIQIDEPSLVYTPPSSKDGEREVVEESLEKIFKVIFPSTKSMLYTYFSGLKEEHSFLLDLKFDVLGMDFVSGDSKKSNIDFLKEQKVEKKLALGLFDARNVKMESEESIKNLIEKIEKFSYHLESDEFYLNPNSGLEFLPREYALRKLKLISSIVKKLNEENG